MPFISGFISGLRPNLIELQQDDRTVCCGYKIVTSAPDYASPASNYAPDPAPASTSAPESGSDPSILPIHIASLSIYS